MTYSQVSDMPRTFIICGKQDFAISKLHFITNATNNSLGWAKPHKQLVVKRT